MQSFLDVLALSSDALLHGVVITVTVSAIAVGAGLVLGAAFGLVLTYGSAVMAFPVRVVVDVVREHRCSSSSSPASTCRPASG